MNKLIQVTQSSMPSFEEYQDEIRDLWESKWLTNMGLKHRELESQLQNYLGVSNITLFTNGHLALECVIAAYGLTGEVITTPFTFASTTHAIVRNGLEPVFCDIDPVNYTIDADKIEVLITKKTSAILPVHVYGNICDVAKIDRIAKKHNLKVIYDAAHAFGVSVNGKGVGTFGDASMFSFHATKVFNTIEGGAVTYQDASISNTLDDLKNFGISSPESINYVGGNAKMNEFQAAMGICNLRHVDDEICKRKILVERYISNLNDVEGLVLSKECIGIKSNYAYFPVLFENFFKSRDDVLNELKINGIIARKYFYPLVSDFACYAGKYSSADTPTARFVADRVLTLPLYSNLDIMDVDRICEIIKRFGGER